MICIQQPKLMRQAFGGVRMSKVTKIVSIYELSFINSTLEQNYGCVDLLTHRLSILQKLLPQRLKFSAGIPIFLYM